MKKYLFALGIFASLILGTSFKANATTFRCGLVITDTCNGGGYSGTYDVEVDVYFNGSPVSTGTGIAYGGQNCVLLTCDLKSQSPLWLYQLKLRKVYRSGGSCGITPNTMSAPYSYWADIATCNINTPVFYVTF
jgi:hypothetical protein